MHLLIYGTGKTVEWAWETPIPNIFQKRFDNPWSQVTYSKKKNPENYKIYKYMLNGWILSYLREIDDFYNRNHCLKYSNCFVCNSLKGIKNDNIKLKLKRLKRVREIIKHKGLLK